MNVSSSSPSDALKVPAQSIALNDQGGAPDWIMLIPAGFDVLGRDGRHWINPGPDGVVQESAVESQPIPLDYEHATEVRAPRGEDAPAAGWIEQLEVRDGGSIWGRVDWTLRGRGMVEAKEYRFVSPVFTFDKATRVIRRLVSVGLTNTPNLRLLALNREGAEALDLDPSIPGGPNREPPETPLSIANIAAALGLAATASEAEVVAAATEARAANTSRHVDLTSYAPRADLEAAVNRASAAEAQLAERTKADHDKAIEAALSAAQDAGKIIPASTETYRAMCREEGGLERFNALVPTLPVIAGAAESRAANKVEKTGGGSALTEEERAVCRALGQDEATFKPTQQEA